MTARTSFFGTGLAEDPQPGELLVGLAAAGDQQHHEPDDGEERERRDERRERGEQVVAAVGRLDPEYRAVLVMRDIEGFDYQQMAHVLGLPLGTLKSRLFRARLALRDELKGYMK